MAAILLPTSLAFKTLDRQEMLEMAQDQEM